MACLPRRFRTAQTTPVLNIFSDSKGVRGIVVWLYFILSQFFNLFFMEKDNKTPFREVPQYL